MDVLIDEALAYVRRVREELSAESSKFKEFSRIMRDYYKGIIGSVAVSSSVKALFEGHDDLISGFNKFSPENCEVADRIDSSTPLPLPLPPSPSDRVGAYEAGSSYSREAKKRKLLCLSGNSNKIVMSIKFLNEMRKKLGNDEVYRKFLEALNEYGAHKDIHCLDSHVSTLFRQNPQFYIAFTEQIVDIFEAKFNKENQKTGEPYEDQENFLKVPKIISRKV